MAGPISARPYEWAEVPWAQGRVLTRGAVNGLPVLTWGGADRGQLATTRQLRDLGLRPGGAEPVAVLVFGHRQPGRREVEHARLYRIAEAAPKRTATPAQRAAIDRALAARRTCRRCHQEQDYYLSTVSRMCGPCSDATGFWDHKTGEHDLHPGAEKDAPAVEPDEHTALAIPAQREAEPAAERQPAERQPTTSRSIEPGDPEADESLEQARHAVMRLRTAAAARALEDTHPTRRPGSAGQAGDLDTATGWGQSA